MKDINVEKRDTSFVTGSIAQSFDSYPTGLRRISLDKTYALVEREDAHNQIEEEVVGYCQYRSGEFGSEEKAMVVWARMAHYLGYNGVGVVLRTGEPALNVMIYEDGSVEIYNPTTDRFTYVEDNGFDRYRQMRGVLLL